MNGHMNPIYRSFLLRLWQAGTPETPVWRASLEDPRTSQVVGFDNLEKLCGYLQSLESGLENDQSVVASDRSL
jgi:hypothetical protein